MKGLKPYFEQDGITIYHGDCREVLPTCGNFEACVTDPPYGLEFMGKGWDRGVPGVDFWKTVLQALKPGGILFSFGGTRTFHRLTCAIEDAGFEIRDCLSWLYGSGFPKSLDISKAIDKAERGVPQGGIDPTSPNHGKYKSGCSEENPTGRGFGAGPGQFMKDQGSKVTRETGKTAKLWNGWGTALKPAWEPIILAMKPLEGTFAENAQRHGVAGVNVDGGRIPTDDNWKASTRKPSESIGTFKTKTRTTKQNPQGRWPANVVLDEEAGRIVDDQAGERPPGAWPQNRSGIGYGSTSKGVAEIERREGTKGGASRFFYTAKASHADRGNIEYSAMPLFGVAADEDRNTHPTVKPLSLMTWLLTLASTPTGGRTLDPFMGSGSTLVAAKSLGRVAVGIDIEEKYCEIAVRRLRQEVSLAE